jgi:hypothetical protein
MGVPAELLGKQVRCPHCKQVVLAPLSAGAPAASTAPAAPPQPAPVPTSVPQPIRIVSPPPAAPKPAPLPQPEPELPVFNVPPRKESADSIMSEPDESDDEVFASNAPPRGPIMPHLDVNGFAPAPPGVGAPLPEPTTGPAPAEAAPAFPRPTAHRPTSPPDALDQLNAGPQFSSSPAPQLVNPLADLEPVSLPDMFVNAPPPAPQPVAAPLPVQPIPTLAPLPVPAQLLPGANAPQTFEPNNPFADLAASSIEAPPAPAPAQRTEGGPAAEADPRKRTKDEKNGDDQAATLRTPPGRAPTTNGVNPIVVAVLAGYALLATLAAVYGLFFSVEKLDPGHPLSTVPDNFGEFDPAVRKKVSLYKFPVDGELPAEQRAALGQKISVGGIEVQPLQVEKRPLRILTEATTGGQREDFVGTAFVLKLAITNNTDMNVFPMDPAFTRKSVGDDRPITRLVVNKARVYAGGSISWPLGGTVKKKYEQQQLNDYVALRPKESREYVVFTEPKAEIINAVENAREPLQWRVQVRRAPIRFRGKELPVTAVIGVDFKASEIKTLEPKAG